MEGLEHKLTSLNNLILVAVDEINDNRRLRSSSPPKKLAALSESRSRGSDLGSLAPGGGCLLNRLTGHRIFTYRQYPLAAPMTEHTQPHNPIGMRPLSGIPVQSRGRPPGFSPSEPQQLSPQPNTSDRFSRFCPWLHPRFQKHSVSNKPRTVHWA